MLLYQIGIREARHVLERIAEHCEPEIRVTEPVPDPASRTDPRKRDLETCSIEPGVRITTIGQSAQIEALRESWETSGVSSQIEQRYRGQMGTDSFRDEPG